MSLLTWAWTAASALAGEGTVTIPLETWNSAAVQAPVPGSVALGAARYSGQADPVTMTLDLHLELDVSLMGDGRKLVPLLGEGVPLQQVLVDGQPVPVTV